MPPDFLLCFRLSLAGLELVFPLEKGRVSPCEVWTVPAVIIARKMLLLICEIKQQSLETDN